MQKASEASRLSSEALTRRELTILLHLSNGRSSQEIAVLESLAYTSVKWYIHQVYAKLGVNSRRDALVRAKELALLSKEPAAALHPRAARHNLPRQLTSFIGREKEIQQILDLVHSYPIVTLTGSGGTGKTRLALHAVEKAIEDFPDGVVFVDLAPLNDPGLVPLVTATALGMHDIHRESAVRILCDTIGRKRLLLVLDNCEHLIAAAAELVHVLSRSCHNLHMITTSREILGVEGERSMRCPPLTLPGLDLHPTLDQLAKYEAIQLFTERARAVSPEFQLNAENAELVHQICLRLDGIPLAIELAAARLRLLSIPQIAARLENFFYLLVGGARTALPRHKTLKAMVDWSYELLSDKERRLLSLLSVFAGEWTVEAAEMICGGTEPDSQLPRSEILDLLAQLVDKSLVHVQTRQNGPPRYRILEMIRQYGHNRLLETSSVEAVRERHLDYYRELALMAEPHLRSKNSRQWIELLENQLPNLRAAMEWALAGSVVKGLRLAATLYWFWFMTKYRLEGLDWLDRLLAAEQAGRAARAEDGPAEIESKLARGKALSTAAYMGILAGRDTTAMKAESFAIFQSLGNLYPRDAAYATFLKRDINLDTCLELAQEIGYPWLAAEVLLQKTFQVFWAGDLEEAHKNAERCLAFYNEAEDLIGFAVTFWTQGTLHFMQGNLAKAEELYKTSHTIYQEAGDTEFSTFTNRFPAWLALAQERYAEAVEFSQVQLEVSQAMNIPFVIGDALGFLGWEALCLGDETKANQYCQKALKLAGQTSPDLLSVAQYVMARIALAQGEFSRSRAHLEAFVNHNYHNWPPVQLGIQLFGILAITRGFNDPRQAHHAAVLFGAQDAIIANLMNVIPPPEREAYRAALLALRALLSAEDLSAAWAEGRAMTTRQAIAYALAE